MAVCTLLWEHPLRVPRSFLIDGLFRNPAEGDGIGLLNIGSFDPPDGAVSEGFFLLLLLIGKKKLLCIFGVIFHELMHIW